jgi:protein-tyrosine phosphatase
MGREAQDAEVLGCSGLAAPAAVRLAAGPDFRVPRDSPAAVATLREAFARAEAERVEVACGGGVGRTGTALAFMAVLSGVPAGAAVAWARAHYVKRAVETPWQRRWLRRVAAAL